MGRSRVPSSSTGVIFDNARGTESLQTLSAGGLEEDGFEPPVPRQIGAASRLRLPSAIRPGKARLGALSSAFVRQALQASEGIPGLSAAMRGLVAARAAVLAAVLAIDADIRRMVRASDA